MATNFESAVDAILGTCKVAIDDGAADILGEECALVTEGTEPDLKPHPEDSGKPWVRATIRHSTAKKVTQNNAVRQARYRRWGLMWAQVFVPSKGGDSWTKAQRLAILIQTAYEGKRAAGDTVVYLSAAIKEAPREGHWTRYDCKVEFSWDEIK